MGIYRKLYFSCMNDKVHNFHNIYGLYVYEYYTEYLSQWILFKNCFLHKIIVCNLEHGFP